VPPPLLQEWADLRARRVTSFGPQWSRARRRHPHESDGAKVTPLPSFVAALVMPVVRRAVPAPLYSGSPNQLCVSVYRGVDSFILPHNDNENDTLRDPILGLSLGSGTSMTLILPKALSPTGAIVKADVALPRRSLYVMSGDALHVWHHGIFEGKTSGTRYSVTLRRVLPPPGEDGEARRKREASRPPREGKRLRQSRLHFK
jgi:alkylated DNA repair dioxygenase AlkB